MKANTIYTPPTTFPLALECLERQDATMDELIGPSDVWTTTYLQGETPENDRLSGNWKKVAVREGVQERDPCLTSQAQTGYVRESKSPGLYVDGHPNPIVSGFVGQAAFSSDGRHLIYSDENSIWLSTPDGSGRKKLCTPAEYVVALKPGIDDDLWYCSGGRLFRHSLSESDSIAVHTDHGVQDFTLSPDGDTVAYVHENSLYLHQLKDGAEQKLVEMPSYAAISNASSPIFSPDGSRILFTYSETSLENYEPWTNSELWVVARSGDRPSLVFFGDAQITRVARPN